MSQSNYNIPNQSAPVVRAQLNSVFGSIATNNSGSAAPSTTFAHQWWYDTTTNILKQRNAANSAWIDIGTFDQTGGTFTPSGQRDLASQAEAEAGTDNATLMTPLRVKEVLAAYSPPGYVEVPGSPFAVSGASPFTVTGLAGFKDILVIGDQITATVSGDRQMRIGNSGGVLATSIYMRNSGFYNTEAQVALAATAAKSFVFEVLNFNTTNAIKPVRMSANTLTPDWMTFINSATAFDRVQLLNSVAATLGGTLRVFGRA